MIKSDGVTKSNDLSRAWVEVGEGIGGINAEEKNNLKNRSLKMKKKKKFGQHAV